MLPSSRPMERPGLRVRALFGLDPVVGLTIACCSVQMEEESTAIVRRRYERIAPVYDILDASMELLAFRRWRRLTWEAVGADPGPLLEVGVGTGKNIAHWPPRARLTAIDLSPRMLDRARHRAEARGIDAELRVMDVEALELPDASFDVAVATFVFCSVAHPIIGLRELRRVLRPGGRLVLLEHQRSESAAIGPLLDLVDPLVVRLWGAHVNRLTEDYVREAGFEIESSSFLTPRGLVRLLKGRR